MHLLDGLDYNFSVMSHWNKNITSTDFLNFNPNLRIWICSNTFIVWRCWNLHQEQPELQCHWKNIYSSFSGIMDWNPIFKENEHFLWSHLLAAKFPRSILNFFWWNIGKLSTQDKPIYVMGDFQKLVTFLNARLQITVGRRTIVQ